MSTGHLTIDLDAIVANWRALDALSAATVETGATVKANAYGLGMGRISKALAMAGVRRFFVAVAIEGVRVRRAIGPGPEIFIYGGHMPGDADMIADMELTPILNSIEQMTLHFETLPGFPFAVQLDSGMNRLGMEPVEWAAVRDLVLRQSPQLVISHLACADEPDHEMNAHQLRVFREMTDGIGVPRSLAATGGVLLGPDYHFDVTRPGIGLYGGRPFDQAATTVYLELPVIQTRDLEPGETVGYGNTWVAEEPTRVATVSAGYADGIHRVLSNNAVLYAEDIPCPVVGRVSMDLITVDVSHLDYEPEALDLLSGMQGVDDLADAAGTIGYEILTSLGLRFQRHHVRGSGGGEA